MKNSRRFITNRSDTRLVLGRLQRPWYSGVCRGQYFVKKGTKDLTIYLGIYLVKYHVVTLIVGYCVKSFYVFFQL